MLNVIISGNVCVNINIFTANNDVKHLLNMCQNLSTIIKEQTNTCEFETEENKR